MSEAVKIIVLAEGKTEKAFQKPLLSFLATRIEGKMPKIRFRTYDGPLPKRDKLSRVVENDLGDYDYVVALADVYPDFKDAADAKAQMRGWVGSEERFIPHVALHDFEAWLLPYWPRIQQLCHSDQKAWAANPETVNHGNPPAHRLKQMFEARSAQSYNKPREAERILKNQSLEVAANSCSELKAFLNTLLKISGGEPLP